MAEGESLVQTFNSLLHNVSKRAEMSPPERLQKTFVEVHPISNALRSVDHSIVYGRRGTGKTHAFTHLSRELQDQGHLALLLDLRRIGSNGGLYSDATEDFSYRASQLLIDVFEEVHSRLIDIALTGDRFSGLLEHLDAVAEAATDIQVAGEVETTSEQEEKDRKENKRNGRMDASVKPSSVGIKLSTESGSSSSNEARHKAATKRKGKELPRLQFGRLSRAFERACASIAPARVWLLLDEWSSVPVDLQPLLADMLRRVFFACPGMTVKIGAIERRSNFMQMRSGGPDYVGIELGADTAAALNLDEHLFKPEDQAQAVEFYSRLINRHIAVTAEEVSASWSMTEEELRRRVFEDKAFYYFVRASEGIPRDAMNILGLAASRARDRRISIADIDRASLDYYLQDKEKNLRGNRFATKVWDLIRRDVVLKRSRTFYLPRRQEPSLAILDLYDARLLHLHRQGVLLESHPNQLFDIFAVDYGSFVRAMRDLDSTQSWGDGRQFWRNRIDDDTRRSAVIFTGDKPKMSWSDRHDI